MAEKPGSGTGGMPAAAPLGRLGIAFAVVVSAAHLWANLFGTLPELQAAGFHFGLFAVLCVLLFPASGPRALRIIVDGLIAAGALATSIYLYMAEDALYARGVSFIWSDWIAALTAIAIVMELARRTTGWVVAAQGGDAEAFAELYEHLAPALATWARLRTRGGGAAQLDPFDLVQEVWLRAWRQLEAFEADRVPFRPWLFRVAKNVLLEAHRAARRARPGQAGPSTRMMALQNLPDSVTAVSRRTMNASVSDANGVLSRKSTTLTRPGVTVSMFSAKSARP